MNSIVEQRLNMIRMSPLIGALVSTALRLRIPEALADSPKTVEDLATQNGTIPNRLEGILLSLECYGYFKRDIDSNTWSNSQKSLELLSEPNRTLTEFSALPINYETIAHFPESLSQNKSALEISKNKSLPEALKKHPDQYRCYLDLITAESQKGLEEFLESIDLNQTQNLLYISESFPNLLMGLLQKFPQVSACLFQTPQFAPLSSETIQKGSLTQRVQVVESDLLEPFPQKFDTILIKETLHYLNDEKCLCLLKNCKESIENGGKLLAVETLVDRNSPNYPLQRLKDIEMMMQFGGKERTKEQFQALFSQAGFQNVEFVPVSDSYVISSLS